MVFIRRRGSSAVRLFCKSWDDAIDRVVNSVKDEKISHFLFSRNGVATPGHPRIPEQFEMAQEMADYIENVLGVYKNK